jgi:hypothetical protein
MLTLGKQTILAAATNAPDYTMKPIARRRVLRNALLSLVFATGCSGPSAPSPPVPPPTAPVIPRPAALVIEHQSASVSGPDRDGYFVYEVRFLLRETTGNASVIVDNVWPVSPDPDEGYSFGPVCFGRTLRVPPSGTLDVFLTDGGLSSLGLGCRPSTWSRAEALELQLQVRFIDDNGFTGVALAKVPVER